MMPKIDREIISHLRQNARISLSKLSAKLNIPVSTIYDKVKQHEKTFIKKHTTLLEFSKLGLHTQTHIAIKAKKDSRNTLQEYLRKHGNVNSLYRINYGFDFLAECVFRNIAEAEDFVERIEAEFGIEEVHKFNVIDELKKEEFLV